MLLEQDCREIVLYPILKNMHGDLSNGSALDQPLIHVLVCTPPIRMKSKLAESKDPGRELWLDYKATIKSTGKREMPNPYRKYLCQELFIMSREVNKNNLLGRQFLIFLPKNREK